MRRFPPLGEQRVKELEVAWKEPQEDWARQRLLAVRLVSKHEGNSEKICELAGVSRPTLFSYLREFRAGGVPKLLERGYGQGRPASLSAEVQAELIEKLKVGEFRRAKEAQAWVLARTQKSLSLRSLYYWLAKSRRSLEDAAQDSSQKGRGTSGSVSSGSVRAAGRTGR